MPGSFGRDRRGQLVLIGAVLVAMLLLGLGLFLNSMTYARVLTAHHTSDAGDRTIGYRNHVQEGVGGVVFYTNYLERGGYGALVGAFTAAHDRWRNSTSRHYTVDGVAATTDIRTTTNGSQVFQATSGAFTSAEGESAWKLAGGVSGTRRFRMNVSSDTLSSVASDDDAGDLTGAGLFHVVVSNGSGTWELYLYDTGDPTVAVVNDSGSLVGTCHGSGSSLVVDVTEGTVDGDHCEALTFPGVTGDYSVEFENGEAVSGRYVLVVDRERSGLPGDNYNSLPSGDGPRVARVLYSVTVEVHYRSPRVAYRTNVTVAPEETPKGPVYGVPLTGRGLVFADPDGRLHSVAPGGHVTTYAAPAVQAIGPKEVDFDGDDRLEIPYVNSSGALLLIDDANETQLLVNDGHARQSKTLVGVGTWRGNTSVYYVNTSDGIVYRVRPGTTPSMVTKSPGGDTQVPAKAVAGVADYNGDGDPDLVYTGDSQRVWYVDDGSTTDTGETVGQNNGIGVGAPRDVYLNGTVYVPFVDGDQTIELLDHEKNVITLGGGDDKKTPAAAADWVGDDRLEVFYVDGSDTLHFFTPDGDSHQVTDEDGDPVTVNDGSGVA